MSSLFAGLRGKFADKLAEFRSSTGPEDPNDQQAYELVGSAANDGLIAPDWGANFNVIDYVNSNVRLNSGRTLKAIKRTLHKPNTKVQLLSLTLLESCVKNCSAEFHAQLATSELWTDVVKLAEDTSITRVDHEVRDKVLVMVEDFSRFLKLSQFQAAYEGLLDRGVDFPVREPDESVPFLTPPASAAAPTAATPAALGADAAPAVAAPAPGAEGSAADTAGADADPLAGLDEQDRVAIQAALAELEEEEREAQAAARAAAEAEAEERRQQQQQQAQMHLLQQQQQQRQAEEAQAALGLLAAAQSAEAASAAQATTAAATAVATATATAPAAQGGAAAAAATAGGASIGMAVPSHSQQSALSQEQALFLPESGAPGVHPPQPPVGEATLSAAEVAAEDRVAALLETACNTTLLLSEMLASVPDSEPLGVREPYVAEVADTCVRLRSRLERQLQTLADEALLASALSSHEDLSRVLLRYDELLAAAEAVVPTLPRNAAAVARSHAAASRGLLPPGALTPAAGPPPPPPQQPSELEQQGQPGTAAGAVPAGQKVAAVAAALKERFAGAFDKLVAAATAARTHGAQPASSGGTHPAAAAGPFGGSGAGTPTVAAAGGAFTLLDDEDEDEAAGENTALLTKRAPQSQPQPLLPPEAAAVAPPPPPPAPLPPAAPEPDLIQFDDVVVPLQPAAATAAAATSPPPPAEAAAPAAHGGTDDLLSGLNLHAPTDGLAPAGTSPPHPDAATASPLVTPPLPTAAAIQPSPLPAVASGVSADDHLVQRLDLIMAQVSANTSPEVAGATGAETEPATAEGGAPQRP